MYTEVGTSFFILYLYYLCPLSADCESLSESVPFSAAAGGL